MTVSGMSFNPSVEQQEQLADTSRLVRHGLTARERWVELLTGLGFVAAAAGLVFAAAPHGLRPAPVLVCIAVMVMATWVQFDTPFGFTSATQLGFVPLLFAIPLSLVPIAVVLVLALATLPAVVRKRTAPSRLVKSVANAWFAIGPVAVLVIAGVSPAKAGVGLLVLALAAQFLVDFVVSGARVAIARASSLADHLRSSWVFTIDAALSCVGLIVAEDIHRQPLAPLALVPLLGLLMVFAHERHDRLESLIELNHAYHGTALVLGNVVETDDGYTGAHSRGVVSLCLELADRLKLSAEQRRNLEFGALLHDVGKIAIPKEIINKPGKLDPAEWQIIRTHTIEGQRLLDTVGGFMHEVGLIVRSHHERWDGSGYPDGLRGEEIPLESRIISCCDTWNAMRTDRSYRQALSFETASAELQSVAGTQLDPGIVAALFEVVEAERPKSPPRSAGARRSAA